MITIACNAPYGGGGLGQHLKQIVETTRSQNQRSQYYSSRPEKDDGVLISLPLLPYIFNYTPVRFSSGWKNYLSFELFDRAVAAQIQSGSTFLGFNGQSLRTFYKSRQLGYQKLILESANSHVANVKRQFQKAFNHAPIEEDWLNHALYRKILQEYEVADLIYVNSEYSRQSFLAEGIAPEKLCRRVLTVSSRFQAILTNSSEQSIQPVARTSEDVFRIVYVGSLTLRKGIAILLEAFSRLGGKAELTLVGGSGTRGMRLYLEDWLRKEPRLQITAGDPLPHLQKADVYVHPSYEDGFAYAPMEALACGIPVIVTEDTGMKEYIQNGVNGYVVPTGNWEAIWERLDYMMSTKF